MTVVVIGGGIAGASAALRLQQAGHDVVLLEAGERLGGLVVSFEVGGTPLECFYHHVFPHETHIRALIDELGLASALDWHKSSVGILADRQLWPFTTPADLLRLRMLPLRDRVHTGVGAIKLQRERDWQRLDAVAAIDWLRRGTGDKAAEKIWAPLLGAKFGPAADRVPAAWMWGRFNQRIGARERGGERLGYLRRGFRQLFDALDARIRALGGEVRTSTRATALRLDGDRVVGVDTTTGSIDADAVLYAGTLPAVCSLVPEDVVDARWRGAGLGVVCVVLETTKPVSQIYWTNVCDRALPFGGIIEHTNLLPPNDYAGRHVVYLSRYFTADEPIAQADPADEAQRWIAALANRHPSFDPASVVAVHPFRTPYAAPLVTTGYLDQIPPLRTHLRGLYLCTTAQIYPQDRGMSEGVRTGTEAAAAIVADLGDAA